MVYLHSLSFVSGETRWHFVFCLHLKVCCVFSINGVKYISVCFFLNINTVFIVWTFIHECGLDFAKMLKGELIS